MTEPTDFLQWSKKCPPGGCTITQIVPDSTTAEPLIQVECRAPTEPLINGRIVVGDLEWDVELGAWILEEVRLESFPCRSSRSSRLCGEAHIPKMRLHRVHQNLWTVADQHIHRRPGDFDILTGLLPTLDRQELRRAPALSSHLTHPGLTDVEGIFYAPPPTPALCPSARRPAASLHVPCPLRLVPRRRHEPPQHGGKHPRHRDVRLTGLRLIYAAEDEQPSRP